LFVSYDGFYLILTNSDLEAHTSGEIDGEYVLVGLFLNNTHYILSLEDRGTILVVND